MAKNQKVAKGRPTVKKQSTIREKTATPGIDKRMAFAILHELQKYKALRKSASFLQKDLEDLYGSAAGQVVMGELTLSAVGDTNPSATLSAAKEQAVNSEKSESDSSSSSDDSEDRDKAIESASSSDSVDSDDSDDAVADEDSSSSSDDSDDKESKAKSESTDDDSSDDTSSDDSDGEEEATNTNSTSSGKKDNGADDDSDESSYSDNDDADDDQLDKSDSSGRDSSSDSSSDDSDGEEEENDKIVGPTRDESDASSDSDDDDEQHPPPKTAEGALAVISPEDSDTDVSDVDVSDVSSEEVSSSDDDDDDSSSDEESSDEESEDEDDIKHAVQMRNDAAAKAKAAAAAAASWTPKTTAELREIKIAPGSDGAQALSSGKPFQRVDDQFWGEVAMKDGGAMADNSYEHVFGNDGFGAKASEKLLQTRGRRFQHEKTKRKRSFNGFSRGGGQITMESNATKFKYD